jgi:glycosyltransferase involved in cell wall biosynthesis
MFKILFLSHDSDLQGAERCLLELVTHLDHTRFYPLVVLPWHGPLEEKLKRKAIAYQVRFLPRWIPSRRYGNLKYAANYLRSLRARLWSLLNLIEREKIDLVYTNTSTLLEGALAAKRARLPHIWHIHEHLRGNEDLRLFLPAAWIDRLTVQLSDFIITPSWALANSRFPNSSKVRVVPNGIDLKNFAAGDGARMRAMLGLSLQIPLVTFIGSISPVKDPLTFVRAAALVHRSHPETYFVLAGASADPTLEQEIRAFIAQAGMANNFRLLGFCLEVADLLAAATVHVSTSVQESFAINLIEAMAAKKPVVATRCGGPEEIVIHGETGFMVPTRNPQLLAEAILTLLKHPEKANAMGEAGRRRAENHFSLEAYVNNISTVLAEVLYAS